MLERLLITVFITLLSIAGYELFSDFHRRRVSNAGVAQAQISGPRILYFRSEHCSSCDTQARLLLQLEDNVQRAIHEVDADANLQLAQAYGVMSLPTTLIMDGQGNARYINYGVVNPMKLTNQWISITG